MTTEKVNLNLTRKWRSKSFDQIVGQDLSVRMLKNSLYLNQFFPVYLFSGQRGCGKTSTARVFAAAINCVKLSAFQKNPRNACVPCLECASCKSMLSSKHPDFIEIDAASHTGVDNVRQIIESSSFMPLMGSKKIYLIDEAHMLSKAAFNAFLKILEEPPSSVIFILATTNPQKIIETVRSRCFQLFFKFVESDVLVNHLKHVCKEEKIAYDQQGLNIIVNESQGSVRDSLNVLEQVRFSSGSVTKLSVQNVLGHIDEARLIKLFEFLLTGGPQDILKFLNDLKYNTFSAEYLWKKLIELVRCAVWVKHGVTPNWSLQYSDQISKLVKNISWERLNFIMHLFYKNESVFIKTTEKHSLLEMILIQMSKKNNITDKSGASSAPQKLAQVQEEQEQEVYEEIIIEEEEEVEDDEDCKGTSKEKEVSAVAVSSGDGNKWEVFLGALDVLKDPLLCSIFKNGEVITFDEKSGALQVKFSKQFAFYQDSLEETKKLWLPLMQKSYGSSVDFQPEFTAEIAPTIKKKLTHEPVAQREAISSNSTGSSFVKNNNKSGNANKRPYNPAYGRGKNKVQSPRDVGKLVDVSDITIWKKSKYSS